MQDDTERTIVAVLNEGEVPFARIIPNNDRAFILEHRVLSSKNKIVLFAWVRGDKPFHMFICDEENEILKEIKYECMENTWSVYNSLCKYLNTDNL